MPSREKTRRRLFRSLPPLDFRARIRGSVEFLCPYCFRMARLPRVEKSRSRHRCRSVGCRKSVAFGLYGHLGGPLNATEPFTAHFADQKHLYHVNRLTLRSTDFAVPAIGKIVGEVDFQCPTCRAWTTDRPARKDGKLRCPKCSSLFWVSLILWSVPYGAKRYLPHDWFPPTPSERHPAPQADERLGPDSDGAGDLGPAPLWS